MNLLQANYTSATYALNPILSPKGFGKNVEDLNLTNIDLADDTGDVLSENPM